MTPESGSLIQTPEALAELVACARPAPRAAMDMEADSLYHYHAKVCVLQIAVEEHASGQPEDRARGGAFSVSSRVS